MINYRVPSELRSMKYEAYTPRMVSIGPLHRDKPELQNMEKEKRRYMSYFVDRVLTDTENIQIKELNGEFSENLPKIFAWNKCNKVVSELEEVARAWYAGDINLDKDQLVEMLLVDGCFILELFHKCQLIRVEKSNDESHPIDSLAGNFAMVQTLKNDLLLLENQIPYVVLQKLFDLIPSSKRASVGLPEMSLGEHIFCFFNSVPMLQYNIMNFKDGTYRHLLDMLYHVFEITPAMMSSNYNYKNWGFTRCATELFKSGFQIICDRSRDIVDIEFHEGEIFFPQVIINRSSDTLLRNLIALEQTSIGRHFVTSYVKLMSTLIHSREDACLLEQLGIITISDEVEDVSAFVRSLCSPVVLVDFCLTELCMEVNDYHIPVWRWRRVKGYLTITWISWKGFRNRWGSVAFYATSSVFILTFLQTFYTIRA